MSRSARIQGGTLGPSLEAQLKSHGLTLRHFPQAFEWSTLGGWIATNASGMKKNRYGNIEDIVLEATLVTPTGDIETRAVTPRNSIARLPALASSSAPSTASQMARWPPAITPCTRSGGVRKVGGHSLASRMPRRPLVPAPA